MESGRWELWAREGAGDSGSHCPPGTRHGRELESPAFALPSGAVAVLNVLRRAPEARGGGEKHPGSRPFGANVDGEPLAARIPLAVLRADARPPPPTGPDEAFQRAGQLGGVPFPAGTSAHF